jgi:hypothetical protein
MNSQRFAFVRSALSGSEPVGQGGVMVGTGAVQNAPLSALFTWSLMPPTSELNATLFTPSPMN